MLNKRRVVVTGMGMLTPLGLTLRQTWAGLCNAESGVSLIDRFDTTDFSVRIAAEIRGFDPSLFLSPKEVRKFDLFIQYGLAASHEAWCDAGITVTEANAERIGVFLGSGIGGLPIIEETHKVLSEQGPRRISPFFIPGAIINMLPGLVSIKYGLKGPNLSMVSACATGAHALIYAARSIAYGEADVMLAGGAEMAISPLGVGGFAAMRALSTRNDNPSAASRPWDKDRDGFVLGEGAGTLVLEEYEHAKQRGATIYAELVGTGVTADAHHMTAPDQQGAIRSMRLALQEAKLAGDAIGYINAHGTSTSAGDISEVNAVKQVMGHHAYQLAMSSTKSMTGHLLGAAGAIEAIMTILALREGVLPPTINLDHPDEGCDLNFVPHQAEERIVTAAMSNSFGFGGTNATVIFQRV